MFPADLIKQCTDCNLRAGCKAPVPGESVIPCEVILVGEAPGRNEDEQGRPFVGAAGKYLDSLLFQSGLSRDSVCITNVVHCRPPNNRTPSASEIETCRKWLELELELASPRIIVAMGAPAIRWFLGSGAGTVEHLHGRPIEKGGRIILPVYHPAAALYNTALLRQCQEDFRVLRGLVKGEAWDSFQARDEYPNPDYEVVTGVSQFPARTGQIAVDTETGRGGLWSAQFSTEPGMARFIRMQEGTQKWDLSNEPDTVIVHNYLFDIQYLSIKDDNFRDSMIMAYLLGLPQGLKELSSRLCGLNMINYNEMVRPYQRDLSLEYLMKVSDLNWPNPPLLPETRWDNKAGELVTKNKRPWHISRKVDNILKAMSDDDETDLWDRWRSIPALERAVVEEELGAMPESTLADIPFDDAVQYACRDADATVRVYLKLREMIEKLELDYVLDMDTAILPMVYSMMQTGIAVDIDWLKRLSEDYDVQMRVKAAELAGMVGHPFNPNSSQQAATVIYGERGHPVTRKTPTGLISTDDQELKKTGDPVARDVIKYRGLQKLKSTYADSLIEWAAPDDADVPRVHTTLKTTRTETGRLASADPNLQNIPTRTKESKLIKSGFTVPDGRLLLEGDYGQIEMCVQAHISRCRGLIDIFLRGDDPHTLTASKIFNVPYDEAKQDKYRYPTKRANFGIIYMIGAEGLSAQIAEYISDLEMAGEPVDIDPWSEEDCEKFIKEWYKLYPEVQEYQMEMASQARRYGYVKDMFGRVRYIPEVSCPIGHIQEAGLRQAANMPVQAGAQGIIKLAMGELWRGLPETEWAGDVRWLMQIHDSLLSEIMDDRERYLPFTEWMRGVMVGVVELLVPLKVDFKVGKRWGGLKGLEDVV